ncbi:regulatory protein RecX [Neptuniibacter marinus]|uniref:regulatory protein RecX n=1 Tax=Neptuniibacter marinus TaxID=1806670 RepID=UPI00083537D5|nr:regulatory protein RecX [Neptuniibacter marinus]
MDREITKKDVWNRAIVLLARREYSKGELRKKLLLISGDIDVESVLNDLELAGYQSDLRFVESFIRMRVSQGHGLMRIRFDLKRKGVDEALIEEVLEASEVDWFELAFELYERKYAISSKPLDYKERARRVRFMSQRGFSFDEIQYAENEVLKNTN